MFYELILYTPMFVTFFWAVTLLLTPKSKNIAKFFLGIFMLAAFLVYFSHAVFFHGEKSFYLYIDPIYTFGSLMVYPLYFVYIKLLSIDTEFKKQNWFLFLPAILISGVTFILYFIMTDIERSEYIDTVFFNTKKLEKATFIQKTQHIVYIIGRFLFAIQVFCFLIKGSKLIKTYNTRIANFYGDIEDKTINWVNLLLWSFVITSIMSIAFNLIGKHYFYHSTLLLLIPSTIFSVLLFMIGFEGSMQNHTITELLIDEEKETQHQTNTSDELLKERLIECFEKDKIYHHQNLKITDISSLLNTNRTYISNVINNDFKVSFSDFVNTYRIDEAKTLLKSKSASKYTLEYIAEKVGFSSAHSFIRVFKKLVGKTPSTYKTIVKSLSN